MNQRRANRATVLFIVLALLTLGRLATQTNVVYDVLEPVLNPLNRVSERLQTVAIDQAPLDSEGGEQDEEGIIITRKNLQSFDKTVWIAAGSSDSIQAGDTVTTVDGYLYGVVIESFSESSIVQTIIDPNFRATAIAQQSRGIVTIEYGSLLFDLVPRVDDSLEGTVLKTDGLDGRLAVNVPIGTVGTQSSSEDSVFSAYAIRLPYNPYDVTSIKVLTNAEDTN